MVNVNQNLSLKNIINIFRDIQVSHYMINDFVFGDKDQFNSKKNIQYPILYLEPTNIVIKNTKVMGYRTQDFGFNLYLLDRINKGDSNYEDILSTQIYILDTVIQQIDQQQYFFDNEMILVGDIVISPGIYVFDDDLNGYVASIKIQIPQRYTPGNNPIGLIN